ncbi:UDP-galactose:fucoside alpha-3-galactosyltransferase-like isoform X2 [Acanthaster planci]|uniref:UDP-galactose:fucoside alpha-3-galactosyltransferase-like isoform X2 n=1 Tax=Acanthaster planci TaxID=133434 RepID=A0A8B7YIB6_ACAPL|nr:UDP-galactose:fucoside alpha-3-galactosyltransferase-like isoform X2 [Acanthaster planci]
MSKRLFLLWTDSYTDLQKMASEQVYKILFFLQSAAFTLFIINYSQDSSLVLKPVRKLTDKTQCGCTNGTREIFQNTSVNASVDPFRRGPLSNCSLYDIKKRPGVVMLTTANLAYVDVVLNMLESVKRVGICINTTVIAEDPKAYDILSTYAKGDPAVYVQRTNSGEMDVIEHSRRHRSQYYGIMNKRQAYILSFLEKGFEVLFTDSDTFWFRDPFPHFQGDFDMCLRGFTPTRIVKKTNFCAGFIYLKPTKATIQFVKAWVEILDSNKKKGSYPADQSVMNGLLKGDKPVHVNIKMLDADLFPWGPTFFNPKWQKQNHSTVVMHAASIRGHPAKLKKFREFGMWLVNVTVPPAPR